MKAWAGRNWFLVGLAVSVAIAFVFPAPGADGGALRAEISTKFAISVIFLIQGLVLPLEAVRAGLMRLRLHVMVQSWIFVVVPLLAIVLDFAFGRFFPAELRVGFLFLAVLPTTISSAVVLTSMARGNSAGALVNTTLSNLAGVVVTPLWLGVLLQARGHAPAMGPLVINISLMILLPFVVGQLLRPAVRRVINAHTTRVRDASSLLVLFIVYAAFCDSVKSGLWSVHDWRLVLSAIVAVTVLFAVALLTTFVGARLFGLDHGDRIAAAMCAPQKTLAAGVPMAKLIFATSPALGLILLPVMLYHALQLVAGAVLVDRMKQTPDEKSHW